MVEFENVGFTVGTTEILQDVTDRIAAGSLCVIFGRPGSGKTNLLRLVRGEIAPSRGSVRVFGSPVPHGDRAGLAALRRRIGSLEREPRFLDHLGVRENVALPLLAAGIAPETRALDIAQLLVWLGLGGHEDASPGTLGPAERRRAALARALAASPDLILADEPSEGLAPDDGAALLRLLVQVNATGKTILITTRDPNLVEFLGAEAEPRLLHLASGRIEALA